MTPTRLSDRVFEPITSQPPELDTINLIDPDARVTPQRPRAFNDYFEQSARAYDDILSLEIDDDVGLEGVMAFQDFLTAVSDARDKKVVNDVAELATLEPDVNEFQGLTDGLILEFLNGIPGLTKEDHQQATDMTATSFLFTPDRSRKNEKIRIYRAEHSFTGTRKIYYSLSMSDGQAS